MPACIYCKVEKPFSSFAVDKRYGAAREDRVRAVRSDCKRNGHASQCRECKAVRDKERRVRLGYNTRYSWENRERANRYRRDYGINLADYDSILKFQNGGCAICGRTPKNRRLDVDHDHQNGKVRGLLCALCNRGLGYFFSHAVTVAKAAQYLAETPEWGWLSAT